MKKYHNSGQNWIVKPATKAQLIALRDALLAWKDKDAATAADNLIDLLSRTVNQYVTCPQCKTGYDERFTHCLVCNSELIRLRGCVEEGHRVSEPAYDDLINGALFTDEHRARLQAWWRDHYSDEAMNKRRNSGDERDDYWYHGNPNY